MANMYERKPQELTGPDGDQPELRVRYIDNGDGTWSLAVAPLSVAPGAATSVKQDTTNLKLDGVIEAIEGISGGGGGGTPDQASRIAEDSITAGVYYVGKADIGTLDSAPDWKIKKLDKTGIALEVTWADSGDYTQVWDDRESLTYS